VALNRFHPAPEPTGPAISRHHQKTPATCADYPQRLPKCHGVPRGHIRHKAKNKGQTTSLCTYTLSNYPRETTRRHPGEPGPVNSSLLGRPFYFSRNLVLNDSMIEFINRPYTA
jgi:hypothetical protein